MDAEAGLDRLSELAARYDNISGGGPGIRMNVTYMALAEMPVMDADGVEPITDKATLKAAFRAFGDVRNADDGRVARFPMMTWQRVRSLVLPNVV